MQPNKKKSSPRKSRSDFRGSPLFANVGNEWLDLMTVPEAAKVLRISPATLREWLKSGKGPQAVLINKRYLVSRASLGAFIEDQSN